MFIRYLYIFINIYIYIYTHIYMRNIKAVTAMAAASIGESRRISPSGSSVPRRICEFAARSGFADLRNRERRSAFVNYMRTRRSKTKQLPQLIRLTSIASAIASAWHRLLKAEEKKKLEGHTGDI